MLLIEIYRYLRRRADKRPIYLKNFVDQSHHHGARTEDPSVSIIIPTRDKVELLRACVESVIEKTSYKNYEIVIVDNQSVEPETLEYFEELKNRGVKILNYLHKFNYSAICNLAAANSKAEYLCFLNNDTYVTTVNWLEKLVDHATWRGVGLVGSKLMYPDGAIQHAGIALSIGGAAIHVGRGLMPGQVDSRLTTRCFEVSGVTFAAVLTSRAHFWGLGGLDEKFRVGFNDLDFALRSINTGLSVVQCSASELVHLESQTRAKSVSLKGIIDASRETFRLLSKYADALIADEYFERRNIHAGEYEKTTN